MQKMSVCGASLLHNIWCQFSIMIKKIYAGTALSNSAISDAFSEQHQQQSIKRAPYEPFFL
jgi:hypothetical protein